MVQVEQTNDGRGLHPETWVDAYGDQLFRYALRRVQNRQIAEDLVQETFLSALDGRARFEGRSSERTWLLGILKHKIVDHIRKTTRNGPVTDGDPDRRIREPYFDERGRWAVKPGRWDADPRQAAENKEFWDALLQCLHDLPRPMAGAFVLREMEGYDGQEASKILSTSVNHTGVLLHRARLRLRHCLELKWFGKTLGK